MFHRFYESMELGMHPAILYPRRSQSRPQLVYSSAPPLYAIGRGGRHVVRAGKAVTRSAVGCPRTRKRALFTRALYR